MSALAFEHEDPNVSWYNRFAKHPYYGKLGKYHILHTFRIIIDDCI